MKKYCLIAALALLAATLCFACGCLHNDPGDTTPIDIPTSEPTQVPTLADPALIDAYLGDWYGVYTVGEAAGVFVPNANVSNDCAMRVAVDGYGRGVCSLTVNGMGRDAVSGSSNVFALCTAEVMQDGLHVDGMINRMPVEWAFTRNGDLLMMQGRCGTDTDYMVISIALARPDVIFSTPLVLAAREYLESAGFMGVVEKLGGSNDELPAVTPPDGLRHRLSRGEKAPRAGHGSARGRGLPHEGSGHPREGIRGGLGPAVPDVRRRFLGRKGPGDRRAEKAHRERRAV